MEKELVKKILKTTNFTSTEIYKLIDIYKDTTMVNTSLERYKFLFQIKLVAIFEILYSCLKFKAVLSGIIVCVFFFYKNCIA